MLPAQPQSGHTHWCCYRAFLQSAEYAANSSAFLVRDQGGQQVRHGHFTPQ